MTTAQATAEEYASRLELTLPRLLERVDRAAEAAGRPPSAVRLVAVTKAHPLEAVDAALAAGLRDLGENRAEELEEKVAARPETPVRWHMIGHVQGRKARRVAELADLIHSVDSLRLAQRLSRFSVEMGREVEVLAQVNTSGESSKSGFDLAEASDAVIAVAELPGLRVRGLMTMAPFVDDERVLAGAFARLRELGERLRGLSDRVGPELSMGMSNDLDVAIREGSTMLRIGTALFGERPGGPA
ncbi:MAG TPA: YggS family pyridoxal phosphate-dependent enzyme [Longimicrobiales bacterium]|nr:YggS family pyridoxal phosphate-dependent enzyme [Longimicrobiales bacterium]